MVDCNGLENRRPRKGSEGSNPSPSAKFLNLQSLSRQRSFLSLNFQMVTTFVRNVLGISTVV